MDLELSGCRAVVTGGTKGIGRAIVDAFLAEGMHVALCARNQDGVDGTAQALRKSGSPVFASVADVTDPADVTRFVGESAEALGGIDVLVNNAGAAHPGGFTSLSDEDWQRDLDVKLFSQIRCVRAALPHLQESSAPRVININAVYGKYPDAGFFATSVNRAACISFSKVLAEELGPTGVLVNSVNIGFVETPQWLNIHEKRAPDRSKNAFFAELAEKEVPLKRFGSVEEVSGVVTFLASTQASYITGASIDVAGGMGKYL